MYTLDQSLCPLLFGGWYPKHAQLAGKGCMPSPRMDLKGSLDPPCALPQLGVQEGS